RKECQHKHGTVKTWIIKEQRYVWKCVDCHGLDFTPSTELGDWVEAAKAKGYYIRFFKDSCELHRRMGLSYLLGKPGGIFIGEDPAGMVGLKLALEKAWEGR
ncbi:hypothetical protein LCGC14_3029550, partial [marine sediment metagenome]